MRCVFIFFVSIFVTRCAPPRQTDGYDYAYRLPLIAREVVAQEVPKKGSAIMDRFEYVESKLKRKAQGDRLQVNELKAILREALERKLGEGYYNKALLLVAEHHELNHRFQEAIDIALYVLKSEDASRKALKVLATSSLAIGDKKTATDAAFKLSRVYPRTSSYSLLGLVYLSTGRESEGIFMLRQALKIEDVGELADSTWARCILARHYIRTNNTNEAKFLILEALRISPDDSLSLSLSAELKMQEGEFSVAKKQLEKAFLVSGQVSHLRQLAEFSFFEGKTSLSTDLWGEVEKIIREEILQGIHDHRLELVKVILRRQAPGDLDEALKIVNEELNLRASDEIYFLESTIYFHLQNYEKALVSITKALSSGAKEARFYALAGLIYSANGEQKRADLMKGLCHERSPNHCEKIIL